tara:strand:- start:97 stop:384 length:288 start_codon:yes stop_codon:yes gene_type:complete
MLVLTRRLDESIIIGGNIEVKVLRISGNQVHLGIKAPKEIALYRKEVFEKVVSENKRATEGSAATQDMLGELGRMLAKPKQASSEKPAKGKKGSA